MKLDDLTKHLQANTYPGRGIVLGKSEDGAHMVMAYFIMGRSVNSRNRVFVPEEEGIRTQAYDPEKLTDPSLVIYAPVRVWEKKTIVTNGDQTDTIYEYLKQGKSFADALFTRAFEPDAPNFTPRISGIVEQESYALSILKSGDSQGQSNRRQFFYYDRVAPGVGHFIHTYQSDGNPIPSFCGEPEEVALQGDIDTFTSAVWEALNADNKVSLFVRFQEIATGKYETRIVNKNV